MSRHQISLTNERQLTEGDKNAGEVARKLHSMVQTLCTSAVHSEAESKVHAMMILSQAANGILHLLARVVMSDKEDKLPVSSTATLFAALLAYHAAPCEQEAGRVIAEFHPLILFDAIKDTEKLSGQQPDDRLDEQMCRVARKCASDPAMIARINKERSVFHTKGAALN